MEKAKFLTRYAELDAERDSIQRQIENLKRAYLAAFKTQPGDKVQLDWPNGDRETLAVTDLYLNNSTGHIRPAFAQVNQDGQPAENEYTPQRGYELTVLKTGAFRQYVYEDGTPGVEENQ